MNFILINMVLGAWYGQEGRNGHSPISLINTYLHGVSA